MVLATFWEAGMGQASRARRGAGRKAVLLAVVALSTGARAQADPATALDGRWHFVIAPYAWLSGIKGDVTVAHREPIPVEKSFSDLWDDFDLGLQGHFEGRKDHFGFGLDVSWMDLGVPLAPDAPTLGFTVDVRQLMVEGFGFYRVAAGGREDNPAHLDLLVGVRFTDTRTRLTALGPAGTEATGEFQELSWADGVGGLRFRAPLGSRAAILGRADVAGFGSKLTWNLEGDLAFLASAHWVIAAGWRHLDIDYEQDEGVARKVFDVAYDGPRIWFAYNW